MSSSLPEIPRILYCAIPFKNPTKDDQLPRLLQSQSVEAALTRLMTPTGSLYAVTHDQHVKKRHLYAIQVECVWPKDKAKAVLDPIGGTITLRGEGFDVSIKTREQGGFMFVVLNPYEVVYRVVYIPQSGSPVIIASKASAGGRQKGDPREPQEEVDSLVLKLNWSRNLLDEFCLLKIATSHDKDTTWAKEQVVPILERMWTVTRLDEKSCWRCVLNRGESPSEMRLRVLFLSFGRKPPSQDSGVQVVHDPSTTSGEAVKDEREESKDESVTEICLRPSHLIVRGLCDTSALRKAMNGLSALVRQMDLGGSGK